MSSRRDAGICTSGRERGGRGGLLEEIVKMEEDVVGTSTMVLRSIDILARERCMFFKAVHIST